MNMENLEVKNSYREYGTQITDFYIIIFSYQPYVAKSIIFLFPAVAVSFFFSFLAIQFGSSLKTRESDCLFI